MVSVSVQRQRKLKTEKTMLPFYLSLTMHGWITLRNHELFNFHLEKLSSRSSYYERICSIGYNSHLNGSLHLLEGIRAEAFNKRLNLSDKWDKCIHDLFLLFTALIPSEGIPLRTCTKWDILHHSVRLKGSPLDQKGAKSPSKAIRDIFDEGHWVSCTVTGVTIFGEEEEREVNATFFPHHPL